MKDRLLIAIVFAGGIGLLVAYVQQMMKMDNEILMWQKAYTELATELELTKLGVMK
jgi:hypothetical protein